MACVRILLFSPGLQVWWHCPFTPLAPFTVNWAWVSVAGSGFSFVPKAVCAVVDCFSFHIPGPLLGSNSTGRAAGWPLSPDRPDTGAGVLIKPFPLIGNLIFLLLQFDVLLIQNVILFLQVHIEYFGQASDILVLWPVQNLVEQIQLLFLLLPTKSNLFNLGLNIIQGVVQVKPICTNLSIKR